MPFRNNFFMQCRQRVIENMRNMFKFSRQINTQNPIQASVFANKDIKEFGELIKAKGQASSNSLFARANEQDIQILFDYIDKNKDGKIGEDEAKAISGYDGDESSLSDEDFEALCEEIQQGLYEQNSEQVNADNLAAQQAYQGQFGGPNYQNYGTRLGNGSYLSSPEQYSTKKKLEDIENKEIPKLKQEKERIQKENEKYVKEQNDKINELLKKEDDALGELDDNYKAKQAEIDECDKKIGEYTKTINDNEAIIHKSNSSISYLEAELANLNTNTDNPKINEQNTARKAEIENQIAAEKEKVRVAQEAIKDAEQKKSEQEKLKETKKGELQTIQEKIKEVKPEVAEAIEKIKQNITEANKKTEDAIEKIDKKIETLQTQAIEYQKDLGTRAGKAASMTGSEVVKRALEIAAGEVGVRESGRNNGAACKYRNGVANGAPWCASFVSYLYGAGQGSDNRATFGYQASVSGILNKARAAGVYSPKGSYTPQPGDIVIMKNGCSHTSIVESVGPNGQITTIGGNEGNAVQRRTYTIGSRGYNRISGFVRMNEWQSRVAQ